MPSVLMLVGQSGVGKNAIISRMAESSRFERRVACTTRKKRDYEEDGVHYHFLTPTEFLRRVKNGEFLEWARVHKNFYGTLRTEFDKAMKSGMDVIFDLDFQGAEQIKMKMPDTVTVFILPPSLDELVRRFETRESGESEEEKRIRFQTARREIRVAEKFDYFVLNDNLDEAVLKIQKLLGILCLGKTPPAERYRDITLVDRLLKEMVVSAS